MHDHRYPGISGRELETIALGLREDGRRPLTPGDGRSEIERAATVRTALILRLLVRIPLRPRQLRDLQLGRSLYRDSPSHWQLRFTAAAQRGSQRGGRLNTFALPFPEALVPDLEAYVERDRPRFPAAAASPYLFLTTRGRLLTPAQLGRELRRAVFVRTGQDFSLRRFRTTWAAEYLHQCPGDVPSAAYWLNETVETVFSHWSVASRFEP